MSPQTASAVKIVLLPIRLGYVGRLDVGPFVPFGVALRPAVEEVLHVVFGNGVLFSSVLGSVVYFGLFLLAVQLASSFSAFGGEKFPLFFARS